MDAATEVLALLDGPDADTRYSETVSQREHALQCAALASDAGAPDALVVAALLHDVGHLGTDETQSGAGATVDQRHEALGARRLRRWFGPEVTGPVALHVEAKRYLVATDPAYGEVLSDASVHSLRLQGGPLDDEACSRFESLPWWRDAVVLRRWDDEAKVAGLETPGLDAYRHAVRRTLRG